MEKDIYCYTAEFFAEKGISRVVFDLDNTVAPYSMLKPDGKIKAYFKSLCEAGITASLVSNNKEERVNLFNGELGLFCVADAKKPSPEGVLRCIDEGKRKKEKGKRKENGEQEMLERSVLVGDQIFTDCLAARRAGIPCFLVEPVQPRESLFFKLKRLLERPFIWRYKKIQRQNT